MKFKIFLLTIIAVIIWIYGYYSDIIIEIIWVKNFKYLEFIGTIIVSFVVTFLISKIIDYIFYKTVEKFIKHDSLAKKVFPIIHNTITIWIWIIAIFITIKLLGYNINTLLTWAWIGWVVLALASKEFIANLFWSLSLVFSKSFKIWDLIKVKWYEWTVDEITLSYTRLVDKRWNYIYMPNKNIITENIENFSHGKFKRLDINLPLPCDLWGDKINKLIEWLEKIGAKLVKEESIDKYEVLFNNFENSIQNIVFNFDTEIKANWPKLKKTVYLEIRALLDKEWISLKIN